MSSAADILPGHLGICHRARRFPGSAYEAVATRVEEEYQRPFLAHGMIFRIVPLEIDFEQKGHRRGWRRRRHRFIGEGLAVRIDPASHTVKRWSWLEDANADMIVRKRLASEDEWTTLYPPDEVESLLRRQADVYLHELETSEEPGVLST